MKQAKVRKVQLGELPDAQKLRCSITILKNNNNRDIIDVRDSLISWAYPMAELLGDNSDTYDLQLASIRNNIKTIKGVNSRLSLVV